MVFGNDKHDKHRGKQGVWASHVVWVVAVKVLQFVCYNFGLGMCKMDCISLLSIKCVMLSMKSVYLVNVLKGGRAEYPVSDCTDTEKLIADHVI